MRFLVLCFAEETKALLLVPVFQNLVRQYSKISISLVCRPQCQIFFYNIPGVHSLGIDLKKKYKGPLAIYRLCRELQKLGPYARGLDFDEDRSNRLLRFFFFFRNLYFTKMRPMKKQLKQLSRRRQKRWENLTHLVERYTTSFERAGLEISERNQLSFPAINLNTESRALAHNFLEKESIRKQKTQKGGGEWIAFLPFTKYQSKSYPLEKSKELIHALQKERQPRIFLFGEEQEKLEQLKELTGKNLEREKDQLLLVPQKPKNLKLEMGLLSQMDIFLGMESLQIHLAALFGIKILSIWGPTHPYSGYGPYAKEKAHKSIQISHEALSCRPCSLKGEKKCLRGDLACMQWISTSEILEALKAL